MNKTQKDIVLEHLNKKGSITTRECALKYDIYDLQGVIRNLKQDGIVILSQWEKNTKTGKTYKRYRIGE